MNLVQLTIDNKILKVKKGTTILQACAAAGIEIPRFCYHEKLSIAGNCRMCLVEVEKSLKPVASCAMPVSENMIVKTNTPLVKKAREGVLEMLLLNHPLDCPICDQGGECDLQDQAMVFGNDRGRYHEYKRSVQDKNCGPLIKTIMTRCIHCTRCIRFATEIAGVEDLGTTGRGNQMEVGTYIEKTLTSELSGNIIDLCPVGALTSKPYAFTARPWELKHTETIDIFDAVGSNIRVDTRNTEIMRILPKLNPAVNDEWISDKVRFAYDGLKRQRLNLPMIAKVENGSRVFTPITWETAFSIIKSAYAKNKASISGFWGDFVDAESLHIFKTMMHRLGATSIQSSSKKNRTMSISHNNDFRSNYIFNSTFDGLKEADICLIIGSNPRTEAPTLNARIRNYVIQKNLTVAYIGHPMDLTYKTIHLGNNLNTLLQIAEGRHPFSQMLVLAKNPIIILGNEVRNAFITKALDTLKEYTSIKQKNINVLHSSASEVAALELGLEHKSISNKKEGLVYLLGSEKIISNADFVIYQGHHGDVAALNADLILPSFAFTEKNGLYLNTECRLQEAKKAVDGPVHARNDWKILLALGSYLGVFRYELDDYSVRNLLSEQSPAFTLQDTIDFTSIEIHPYWIKPMKEKKNIQFKIKGSLPLIPKIENFYITDVISKASTTMLKCSNNHTDTII